MDPRYMETCEFDTPSITLLQKKEKKKKKKSGSYGIKLGPDLLRLVSLLGLDKSYVRGRGQFY